MAAGSKKRRASFPFRVVAFPLCIVLGWIFWLHSFLESRQDIAAAVESQRTAPKADLWEDFASAKPHTNSKFDREACLLEEASLARTAEKFEFKPSEWGFSKAEEFADDGHTGPDRLKAFRTIYAKDKWYGGSGQGSDVQATTEVRCALSEVRARYSITSLFDISGDFRWMKLWLTMHPDVEYYGADIVPEVVATLQKKYARSASVGLAAWSFHQVDLVCSNDQPLRLPGTDLVLLREVLQHNTQPDIMQALRCVSGSGARYLLVTPYIWPNINPDAWPRFRSNAYNLSNPPFSLPPALMTFPDNGKHLALWELPLDLSWTKS